MASQLTNLYERVEPYPDINLMLYYKKARALIAAKMAW
jgi:hypothetical protein